jgi:hypothetical protein
MAFCREQGWEHLILEATMQVNERLEAEIPAAESPDQIDAVLNSIRQQVNINSNGANGRVPDLNSLSNNSQTVIWPAGD